MWERDGERQRERGVCLLLLCGRKRKRRALQFAIGLLLYNFTTDETLCLPPMLSPQLPDGELWQVLNLFSSPVPSYCYTYTRARRTRRPIAHHHDACARVSCLIWSTNRHGDIITLLYVFWERLGDSDVTQRLLLLPASFSCPLPPKEKDCKLIIGICTTSYRNGHNVQLTHKIYWDQDNDMEGLRVNWQNTSIQ